jgi:3-deoxy-D-manno-octulosonate 8-phosphate phosphatase (KDO 8-P phosphatase)
MTTAIGSDAVDRGLNRREILERARAIKLLVSDWSGVLGDRDGNDQFSLQDRRGIEALRKAGIRITILTSDRSTLIGRRAEAVGSIHVFLGVKDKAAQLAMITDDTGLTLEAVAYIGADASDASITRAIGERGLVGVPQGAAEELAALAHHRCKRRGGDGAFREFAEWILELRSAKD